MRNGGSRSTRFAPAVIRTPLVDNMPEKQVRYMTDKIPMKRCGTLEEAANIAAYYRVAL
ncbi:hypothetical protein ACQ86N_12770 [Puia sp. P3]|uniref:hypothetical protein n=1 Tax=Puia sp. P3 TaxID=3423952 RepID=UPI003D673D60